VFTILNILELIYTKGVTKIYKMQRKKATCLFSLGENFVLSSVLKP